MMVTNWNFDVAAEGLSQTFHKAFEVEGCFYIRCRNDAHQSVKLGQPRL